MVHHAANNDQQPRAWLPLETACAVIFCTNTATTQLGVSAGMFSIYDPVKHALRLSQETFHYLMSWRIVFQQPRLLCTKLLEQTHPTTPPKGNPRTEYAHRCLGFTHLFAPFHRLTQGLVLE